MGHLKGEGGLGGKRSYEEVIGNANRITCLWNKDIKERNEEPPIDWVEEKNTRLFIALWDMVKRLSLTAEAIESGVVDNLFNNLKV